MTSSYDVNFDSAHELIQFCEFFRECALQELFIVIYPTGPNSGYCLSVDTESSLNAGTGEAEITNDEIAAMALFCEEVARCMPSVKFF